MDLTDKEAALDAHCTIMCGHKHKQDVICLMECPDYEVFNHLPSVQPAVKDTNVLNNDYISRQAAIDVEDGK